MKLGVISANYPQQRLILGAQVPDVVYKVCPNYWAPLYRKLNTYEFFFPFFRYVDAYHTVNVCMLTKKPWCCTFETMIPRGGQLLHAQHHKEFDVVPIKRLKKMLEIYAKDNCKKLMALSECNYKQQLLVYELFPELADVLTFKTCHIKVPQPLLVKAPKSKVNDKVRFFFVGNDFTRKGAVEIILAAHMLRKERDDFELVIVTNTQRTYNYVFKDFQDTEQENDKIFSIIENSKDYLSIYPPLPFKKVKELMLSCDVGLLPTWGETYGFSVLEMQAAGLPVISTGIRALHEINPYGWIIDLPTNWAGELALKNRVHKEEVRKAIVKELHDIFHSICENRGAVIEKSIRSFDFIKTQHDLESYRCFLQNVYKEF